MNSRLSFFHIKIPVCLSLLGSKSLKLAYVAEFFCLVGVVDAKLSPEDTELMLSNFA